jgi:hypothetical protein
MTNILFRLPNIDIYIYFLNHKGEGQIYLASTWCFGEGAKAQSIIVR